MGEQTGLHIKGVKKSLGGLASTLAKAKGSNEQVNQSNESWPGNRWRKGKTKGLE